MNAVDLFCNGLKFDGRPRDNAVDATATPIDARAQRATQILVKLFMYQLRKGCSNSQCDIRTCHSYRKRVSETPLRPLSELSLKASAFFLASLPQSYGRICPNISLDLLEDYPIEFSSSQQNEQGYPWTTKKDPKSFTQAFFDTRTINEFIGRPVDLNSKLYECQENSTDRHISHSKYIPSLADLKTRFQNDKDYTRSCLADATELLAEKMEFAQLSGEIKPLLQAITVSIEILSAWIDFHHHGQIDGDVNSFHNHSQYCEDVARSLEDEFAMFLAHRLIEVITSSSRWAGKDKSENSIHQLVCRRLTKSDQKLLQKLETDRSTMNSNSTKTWHKPSNLLVLFHVIARIMLLNWDGTSNVGVRSTAGICLVLLSQLKIYSKTWDVRSGIKMHGGANNFQLPEIELFLEPYNAALALFEKDHTSLSFIECPWMFSTAAQAKHFRAICFCRMQRSVEGASLILRLIINHFRHDISRSRPFFLSRAKSLMEGLLHPACAKYLEIVCKRKSLLDDAFNQLWRRQERELLRPLRVNIVQPGEEGLDNGGVAQEFLREAMAQAFDPSYGCFMVDPATRMAWFDPKSMEPLYRFELLGLLCALAVYNGFNLSVNFPLALYKKLIGENVGTIADIEDGWPALAKGLKQLRDWQDGDVAEVFSRTYVFSFESYGHMKHIDMSDPLYYPDSEASLAASMPSSDKIAEDAPSVTNENREAFIADYIQWLTNFSIKPQYKAFASGFHRLFPLSPTLRPVEEAHALHHEPRMVDILSTITPVALQTIVEGQPSISVQDLQAGTLYEGYTAQSRTIKSFWSIVRKFNQVQLRHLLEFVTATDRVPVTGARHLEFIVQRNGSDSERLPTATTCFGRLLLPDYASRSKLEKKLLVALENSTGFGLR